MINDEGSEVPENTIIVIPHSQSTQNEGNWRDIIVPLRGINKRDWFTDHFLLLFAITYRKSIWICNPINEGRIVSMVWW